MKNEYQIAERNLAGFEHEVAKLNKRAAKLGVSPIVLRRTGNDREVQVRNEITNVVTHVNRFIGLEVSGESPKFAGYTLAAVLEVTEAGTIIRKSPGCELELAPYRNSAHKCDHCNLERNRAETFLCVHESGSIKQVGRNCIKDFLGHKDPHQLAKWAELLFALAEMAEGCEDGDYFGCADPDKNLIFVETYLAYVALAIRMKGYVSATAEREAGEFSNVVSTRSTAQGWMNPFRGAKLGKDYFLPEPQDSERGAAARQYVLDTLGAKDAASLSDFENNMLIACKCSSVDRRNAGMIAFVPEYFARETEKRIQKEKALSTACHFGEIKKRYAAEKLTYLKSSGFESMYGYQFLHSFQHASGARIMWKTGTELDLSAGEEVNAKFTVKAHEDYKGFPQTKVTRMEIWNDRLVMAGA